MESVRLWCVCVRARVRALLIERGRGREGNLQPVAVRLEQRVPGHQVNVLDGVAQPQQELLLAPRHVIKHLRHNPAELRVVAVRPHSQRHLPGKGAPALFENCLDEAEDGKQVAVSFGADVVGPARHGLSGVGEGVQVDRELLDQASEGVQVRRLFAVLELVHR